MSWIPVEESHLGLDTSYEPFSLEPTYLGLNAAFVDTLPLEHTRHLLDVACGTGVLTGLLVDRVLREGRQLPDVVGVDISAESLGLAVASFAAQPDGRSRRARFLHGPGDSMPVQDAWADVATVGNALHLFEDLPRLLGELHRVLRAGGVLAFNSSFYAGTFEPGTEGFYTEWMRQALAHLRLVDRRRREEGGPGLRRRRGGTATAFANPWLAPDDYARHLTEQGFTIESVGERSVELRRPELEAIGSYAGLAAVLLSGYPVPLAAAALRQGVQPALEAVGADVVTRRWLEMVARRS